MMMTMMKILMTTMMMKMNYRMATMQKCLILLAATCTAALPLGGIDIAEKRARLEQSAKGQGSSGVNFTQINSQLIEKKKALEAFYKAVLAEYSFAEAVDEIRAQEQLKQLQALKSEIQKLEDDAKALSQADLTKEEEGLWHQPDTTIGQLVIDYGSQDYIYLMPPEIAGLNVHVSSQLAVPRAMWSEMLEMILANYGIGSKQLNSYMRQLFFLRLDQSSLTAITDDRTELPLFKDDSRICFVLHPPATELKRIFQFMEKFSPQEQMNITVLSNSIVMIGYARDI